MVCFSGNSACPNEYWSVNSTSFHANNDSMVRRCSTRHHFQTGWGNCGCKNVLCPLQRLLRHPLALPLEPKTTRVKALNGSQWENTAPSVTALLTPEYHKGKCLHVLASITSQIWNNNFYFFFAVEIFFSRCLLRYDHRTGDKCPHVPQFCQKVWRLCAIVLLISRVGSLDLEKSRRAPSSFPSALSEQNRSATSGSGLAPPTFAFSV